MSHNSRPKPVNLSTALAMVVALDELTQKYNIEPNHLGNGFSLMRDGKAEYRPNVGGWICYSQDGGNLYAVDLENVLCTCPDSEHRNAICKHFIACWIQNRVNQITDAARDLVREGVVRRERGDGKSASDSKRKPAHGAV